MRPDGPRVTIPLRQRQMRGETRIPVHALHLAVGTLMFRVSFYLFVQMSKPVLRYPRIVNHPSKTGLPVSEGSRLKLCFYAISQVLGPRTPWSATPSLGVQDNSHTGAEFYFGYM
jgi:hypothetical protein